MIYKVMIVDDSVMMRKVIHGMISKWSNFEVVANAENGKKALDELARHSDLSLILLDIEMPEMDGLEFLQLAKARTKAKIVVLSSIVPTSSPYATKAFQLGADAVISKPFGASSLDLVAKRSAELEQALKKVLAYSKEDDIPPTPSNQF